MEHDIMKFILVSAVLISLLVSCNAASPVCNTLPPGLIGYNKSCSNDYQCVTGVCTSSICACNNGTTYSTCAVACVADCNTTVTATTGAITSPGYPNSSYTTYCAWTIQGLPEKIIAFNMTYMDLVRGNSCAADYIEIFDGPSTSSRTFGKNCTPWQTLTLSTTNYMTVAFRTSGGGRFLATFKSLDKRITLSESKGFISSPGYPLGYLNNMFYTWTIQGNANTYIVLNFRSFELEACPYDYVQIYDGRNSTSSLLYTLCYPLIPNLIVSTSNSMHIVFKTDVSVIAKGFYASFASEDYTYYLNTTSGVFNSSGYPNGYNNYSTCSWKIVGDVGTRIFLNFTDFDVSNCEAVFFLSEYNDTSQRAIRDFSLCSRAPPFSIFSSSNAVFIAFITSGLTNYTSSRGFNIRYTIKDLPHEKPCSVVDQCRNNLKCLNGTCNCTSDTFYNNFTLMCHPKIDFQGNCSEKQECKSNLNCLNGTCSCYQDYYYSQFDVMCTPVLDHTLNCNTSVTAMCNSSKYLECLPDVNGNPRCLCEDNFYFEDSTCVSSARCIVQRLQPQNKSTTGVELQWEASTLGPNRTYSVSWVSASDETDRGTQAANESGVTVTGLTPGTSYKIAVYTVIQPQGYYPARNTSTTVNIVTYPAQPGLVNPTASKLDKPPYIIRFQPSEGRIENYMISFKSKRHELNKTVATHVVELSDLQADTEYNYSIKAVNSVGDKSSETEGGFKTANLEVETSIGMITGATMGSLVAVVLLVVFIIIFQYKIVDWMGEAKQKSRNREEQVDSRNENEETYDSLDDTINHMIVDADHYDKYNVLRGINPEFVQANIPPLPPRPQPNQYIDLGLVPIKNTQHSLNDMSIDLMYTGVTSDSQEEDNAEETNLIESNFLRLIDTSNVDCIEECDLSKLKRDLVDQTKESSENLDEISGESETTSTVKGYDSLMTRTARTEENKYFSFTDDLHNKISVDNDVINTDKDGYLTPTKPAEADNTRDETDDQTEIKNIDNDGYLSLINSSLDDEGHTLDSSDPKYIHVDSCQGSPSLPIKTDQIDEEDDQSYIHPIDPDDPSLPITYGYHKWDGAKDAGNHYIKDTEV